MKTLSKIYGLITKNKLNMFYYPDSEDLLHGVFKIKDGLTSYRIIACKNGYMHSENRISYCYYDKKINSYINSEHITYSICGWNVYYIYK